MLSRPASPSALHALPPSQGQGLAAVRHFDPAYVGLGQNPKSTVFGLMSALASCGHNAKSGFVSTVPAADVSRCSKMILPEKEPQVTQRPRRRAPASSVEFRG